MKRACLRTICCFFFVFPILFGTAGCKEELPYSSGEVVRVYVAHNEKQYIAAMKEFQERTGIEVQVWSAGTGDCLERIASESDHPKCDVMWGGTIESLKAYEQYFQPYVSIEDVHILDQFKDPNDLWIGESQQPAVIMYNRRLVADSEAPKTWEDLLDPKWRGQIASAELSGVGTLTGEAAEAVIAVLLDGAALRSADMTANGQTLTVTLESGVRLQLGVSGDMIVGCGGWSCPEFFEAFEAAL